MQKSMTSHVGGIFWAMYYGEENYSSILILEKNGIGSREATLETCNVVICMQQV